MRILCRLKNSAHAVIKYHKLSNFEVTEIYLIQFWRLRGSGLNTDRISAHFLDKKQAFSIRVLLRAKGQGRSLSRFHNHFMRSMSSRPKLQMVYFNMHLTEVSFQPNTFRGETQILFYKSNQGNPFFLFLCCLVKLGLLFLSLKDTASVTFAFNYK